MPWVYVVVKAVYAAYGFWAAVQTVVLAIAYHAALFYATSAIMRMIARPPSMSDMMGNIKNRGRLSRQSDTPRRFIYGKARVSGPMVFCHETGTDREYIHIVFIVASHRCKGFTKFFIGEEEVTIGSGGLVTTGTYANLARIIWFNGAADQTAISELVSESGGLWTTDHRLRGCAGFYVRLKWDQEKFSSGLPNLQAEVEGNDYIFDPRDSTYKYTDNAALCINDYMRALYGLNIPASEIKTDVLIASANCCDELVDKAGGGTEKRYTINGDVNLDTAPNVVLETMLTAMAGTITNIGGMWYIRAGMFYDSDVVLNEDDLRAPMSVATKVPRRDLANGGKGVYVAADDNWQVTDFVPYAPSLYLTQDQNERLWKEYSYPFTISPSTARRLTKLDLERMRQQITTKWPCKLTAMAALPGETIRLNHAKMGWVNKQFEVLGFKLSLYEQGADGKASAIGVDLDLKEIAPEVYDWDSGDDVVYDLSPDTTLPNPRNVGTPSGLTLVSGPTVSHRQSDGTFVPRLKVSWALPADSYVKSGGKIRIQYKALLDTEWLDWMRVDGSFTEDYITDIRIGVDYVVRIRGENTFGNPSAWVTSSPHTIIGDTVRPSAPSAPTTSTQTTADPTPIVWETGGLAKLSAWVSAPTTHPADAVAWEVRVTNHVLSPPTDNDPININLMAPITQKRMPIYTSNAFPGLTVSMRIINSSWLKSAYSSASSVPWTSGVGDIGDQKKADTKLSGVSVGSTSGTSVSKVIAIAENEINYTPTGTASAENFNISITGRGFVGKADNGFVSCCNDSNIKADYQLQDLGSTNTNCVVRIRTLDGTNLPNSSRTFLYRFTELD